MLINFTFPNSETYNESNSQHLIFIICIFNKSYHNNLLKL